MKKQYWLMKSEPEEFSLDELKKSKTTWWTGVRNYQARNFMTQQMKPGDQVLFYHSNSKPSGVAGLATISKKAKVDETAFDPKSDYFDKKSKKESPTWYCAEVKYQAHFNRFVPLEEIKAEKSLSKMMVVQKGSRLSIQPVDENHFEFICKLGGL